MGDDALRQLRQWQRAHASEQDKAMRTARRALRTIEELDTKREHAATALAGAVRELEASGLARERVADLLDISVNDLARSTPGRRPRKAPDHLPPGEPQS